VVRRITGQPEPKPEGELPEKPARKGKKS